MTSALYFKFKYIPATIIPVLLTVFTTIGAELSCETPAVG